MTLVDNNYPVDDEVRQIVEDGLSEILVYCQPQEWIRLDEIYRRLEVKYTSDRQGSLDALIDETLDRWNWHCEHSGRGILSYVRSYRAPKTDRLILANGREAHLAGSWPPPAHPDAPFVNDMNSDPFQGLRRIRAALAERKMQTHRKVECDEL